MKKLLLFILFPILTYGQVQIGQDIDGENLDDWFGFSVTISDNGNIIAIGAPQNNDSDIGGYVKIYENQNGNWTQIGQNINGGNSEDFSGASISLSSNGEVLAIGTPNNDDNANNSGEVKIYENQDGNWIQIGQDINGEGGSAQFGSSVKLSSNGSILAIGGFFNNTTKVYIFQDNNWIQIGEDINGNSGDNLGNSVSLSSDGNTIALAATITSSNPLLGYISVFENQDGTWTQVGENIQSFVENDGLGQSISLSNDGNRLAVGLPTSEDIVRVYENQNGSWIQIGQDIEGEPLLDNFGVNVSFAQNGNILAIGASSSDNSDDRGNVKIYSYNVDNWIQIGQDIIGEEEGDFFSDRDGLSLSQNGNALIVGAFFNDGNGINSGHARVFNLSDILSTEEFSQSTFSLYPNPASTQVTIDLPQESTLEKVTIYNSLGQLVLSSKEVTIDTSTLSKGMYIVEVLTTQGTSSKKLIIE